VAIGHCGAIVGGPEDKFRHLFEAEAAIETNKEGAQEAIR
jgi:hypothetical protein